METKTNKLTTEQEAVVLNVLYGHHFALHQDGVRRTDAFSEDFANALLVSAQANGETAQLVSKKNKFVVECA